MGSPLTGGARTPGASSASSSSRAPRIFSRPTLATAPGAPVRQESARRPHRRRRYLSTRSTVSVAVVVGEFPAAFVQYSVYVNVPSVTGVTEFWPAGRQDSRPAGSDRIRAAACRAGGRVGGVPADAHRGVGRNRRGSQRQRRCGGFHRLRRRGQGTLAAADGPPRLTAGERVGLRPTAVGVIVSLPLAANVPLHAPDAVQLVALTEDHAHASSSSPTATEAERVSKSASPAACPK